MTLSTKTLLALLPFFLQVQAQASGSGTTTRYWDCCKPSCAWSGKAALLEGSSPVATCDINDNVLTDPNAASGCDGGDAYMCSDQAPWAVSDELAYGYAAVNIAGGSEASWCCACYELTFTSGAALGKKMIVQATNTGGDLGSNQFDINIPGGGVGLFNGCTAEWGAPSSGWGAQYGGVSDVSDCSALPSALQAGCDWRFDWFQGADNPTVDFTQVECPAALTAKTGCSRADDSSLPIAIVPGGGGSTAGSSAAVVSSSIAPVVLSNSAIATTVASGTPAATSSSSQYVVSSSTPVIASSSSPAVLSSSSPVVYSSSPDSAPSSSAPIIGSAVYAVTSQPGAESTTPAVLAPTSSARYTVPSQSEAESTTTPTSSAPASTSESLIVIGLSSMTPPTYGVSQFSLSSPSVVPETSSTALGSPRSGFTSPSGAPRPTTTRTSTTTETSTILVTQVTTAVVVHASTSAESVVVSTLTIYTGICNA